jgi:hypothetical protein
MTSKKICSVEGCSDKHRALGYCTMHYMRKRNGRDMQSLPRYAKRNRTACRELNCEQATQYAGYCMTHAERYREGPFRQDCQVDGCSNRCAIFYTGLCRGHQRQRKLGQELQPLKRIAPSHGRLKNELGYITIWAPDHPNARKNGRVLEHVAVVSAHIGRALLPEETVHHKNGNRADNRIENLELWSSRHPAGQRVQDKVEFAREILDEGAPEAH